MLNRFGSNSDAMWSSATGEENNSSKADHISFDWNISFSLRYILTVIMSYTDCAIPCNCTVQYLMSC